MDIHIGKAETLKLMTHPRNIVVTLTHHEHKPPKKSEEHLVIKIVKGTRCETLFNESFEQDMGMILIDLGLCLRAKHRQFQEEIRKGHGLATRSQILKGQNSAESPPHELLSEEIIARLLRELIDRRIADTSSYAGTD